MKQFFLGLGLVAVLTGGVGGCATNPETMTEDSLLSARITGSVTYRERIALPPGAELYLALLDVSRQDIAATVVADKTFVPERGVPIPFELEYDPADIDPRLSYVMRATIRRGDNVLFMTDSSYGVLTRGFDESVELVLVRSGGTEPIADAELTNTRWMLRTLDNEEVRTQPGQRALFLQFEQESGNNSVFGYSGCNTFSGGYLADGARLSFDGLASTRRACRDGQLEDRFLSALQQTQSYLIQGNWLILFATASEIATFEAWYE